MKVLVDMNLSPRWVEVLAEAGILATHWVVVGAPHASDAEIMAYAAKHHFVVLTHDLDFGAILAATQSHKPSVVQLRAENPNPGVAGKRVVHALLQMAPELQEGALLSIDLTHNRLRLLPLHPPHHG
jgi:predicted nuclease of predicted toxin-antitoxin system